MAPLTPAVVRSTRLRRPPHASPLLRLHVALCSRARLFCRGLQDGSSAKTGEGGVAGEEGGAPKSGDSMDADVPAAAPPAEAVPVDGAPSKTAATAAADVPETPTPMETDDVEQLE